MTRYFFRALAALSLTLAPVAAVSAEIELTWERSQLHQVEVAPEIAQDLVALSLDGQGRSLPFAQAGQPTAQNRILYQVLIPTGFPVGRYVVNAAKSDGTFLSLAIIKVVEFQSQAYSPLKDTKTVTLLSVTLFALLATWGLAQTDPARREEDFQEDQSTLDSSDGGALGRSAGTGTKIHRGLITSIHLDQLRSVWSISSGRYSPILSRLISDGGYLQYSLGALVLLLPLSGVFLGGVAFSDIAGFGGIAVPSLSVFLAILVIATFDAMAGFIAAITFGICALTSSRYENVYDIRLYLGLFIIWCAPSLIANATRTLRRSHSDSNWWERATDVLVGSFITGWAINLLVLGLNGLAHLNLPITKDAALIGFVVGGSVALRYLVEEFVNSRNPHYLAYLSPKTVNTQSPNFRLIGWFVKAFLFLFFAVSFLGLTWHVWAALALFMFPHLIKVTKNFFPNNPVLYQILPVGIPGIVLMTLIGKVYTPLIDSLELNSATASRTIFVLAALPGFIISILKLFGREPRVGDTRWYMRESNRTFYRVGGVIMFVLYLALTFGWVG